MTLVRRFNHPFLSVLDDVFNGELESGLARSERFNPAVNIKENENDFSLELAAPGFSKDDFTLKVEKDVLNISAKKESNEETKDESKLLRREFSYRSFKRSFTLPDRVNSDGIEARYTDGILLVNIPKASEEEIGIREIAIA